MFLPWAYVRGLAFNARNTSFHGLRFSFRKSYGVMYIIYLPVIVAVLIPAYYFAINYEGDYLLFENYLKEDVFLMLLSVLGRGLIVVSADGSCHAIGFVLADILSVVYHLILRRRPFGVIMRY